MRPRYLYLYVFGSPSITIYCKNPKPNIVRPSMDARVLLLLPFVASLMHAFFPKITFLSTFSCFQQGPNIDMWLIPSHLTFVCLIDLPSDRLEIFPSLCYLRLSLCGLLLECIYCLHYNFVNDQPWALCLGL
jgi:hypothetical protein